MAQKPTLIFVPGAWHRAETWSKVTSLLEQQGYKCIAVSLPTTRGDASKGFGDDVTAVREAIISETTKGIDVVVVVHSYGGAVGQSAIKDLTVVKQTTSSPSSGHVIGLFVIASGFGPTGSTFLEGLGGTPPPIWSLEPSGFSIITVPARELFYHDLPIEEGEEWVTKLELQSSRAFNSGAEFAYAGWKDVKCWVLATTEDKALPVEAQRYFVQMARDADADVTLREIASSHSPMLSRPEETVGVILEAVVAFSG